MLAVWSEGLMDWAMQDEAFKVQLFRFVDCFPTLKDNDAVYDHLTDYLAQPGVTPPPFVATALKAGSLAKGVVTKTMSGQITSMAWRLPWRPSPPTTRAPPATPGITRRLASMKLSR